MLYSIMTPDGVQSVMSIRDFEDIAKQYISDDYADAVRDTLNTAIEEKTDAIDEMQYDLNEANDKCGRLDSLCGEVMDELNELVMAIREKPTKPSLLQLSMLDIADKLEELADSLSMRE